jgi:dimethylhistidine N-methyltransferase
VQHSCDISEQILETPAARPAAESLAADVLAGLANRPKTLSSAWFYDERGSELFQRITQLEEYYLTRCEREILEHCSGDIATVLAGAPVRVVEIGAGDGHKTEILLDRLLAAGLELEYVPIDICRTAVESLTAKLRRNLGNRPVRLRGVVADYFEGLASLRGQAGVRSLVLFLGSSIGNFDHGQARRLLRALRQAIAPGDLALIGFDLKKDVRVLQRAYDDAAGITREFNFNLLERINRELGGTFDRRRFDHHAAYNFRLGCMESWLVSRRRQQVTIAALGRSFALGAWEGIRVERSYKYDPAQIESLARKSGFEPCVHLADRRRWFVDSLWEAV